MRTYDDFVSSYVKLLESAKEIPLGEYRHLQLPALPPNAPVAAIFSPHPDDEILSGAPLALQLRREGYRIVNVAMTLGRPAQRVRRRAEVEAACAYIGFDLELLSPDGFNSVSSSLRKRPEWVALVHAISQFIDRVQPKAVIMHHTHDAHHDHQGTAYMVRDAFARSAWSGLLFEAEYWCDMYKPNLMLEVSASDLASMLEALSFHKGELARNPYHLRWPALLSDNVRRSEIVLGRGATAPAFDFAVMYRRNVCEAGKIHPKAGRKQVISKTESIAFVL